MTSLDQLLSTGPRTRQCVPAETPPLLARLYEQTNGFYLFDDALHFARPKKRSHGTHPRCGVASEDRIPSSDFFFTEDLFGEQFAVRDDAITFSTETGAYEHLANDLEACASPFLEDGDFLTGRPVAIARPQHHNTLRPGQRLAPTRPFMMGGEYETPTCSPWMPSRRCASGARSRSKHAICATAHTSR